MVLIFQDSGKLNNDKNKNGGAGYRSRYFSHAKRALYHLSYAPNEIREIKFLFYLTILS